MYLIVYRELKNINIYDYFPIAILHVKWLLQRYTGTNYKSKFCIKHTISILGILCNILSDRKLKLIKTFSVKFLPFFSAVYTERKWFHSSYLISMNSGLAANTMLLNSEILNYLRILKGQIFTLLERLWDGRVNARNLIWFCKAFCFEYWKVPCTKQFFF